MPTEAQRILGGQAYGKTGCAEAAMDYARRGWRVFPLTGKVPAEKGGCGCLDATADLGAVAAWFRGYAGASVGIATGATSGLVALDVDADKGGFESLHDLETKHGLLPDTPRVVTGGGGTHIYLGHPGGHVPNSAGRLGPGLDIRGDGGYVVAPPSVHPDTLRTYQWEAGSSPDDVPLAPMPGWLLDLLRAEARSSAGPLPDSIPDGQRNDTLTSVAGSLRRRGLDAETIAAALAGVNAARCNPPLPDDEVKGIAQSVARYPAPSRAGNAPAAAPEWPADVDPAAFYGLAGDVAQGLEPFTEADPHALLMGLIVR